MAVVGTAEEMPNSPEGNFSLGKYEIRRYFRVIVDSINDGPFIVASASGLPLLYSTYSFGNESYDELRLREFRPTRMGSAATKTWKVEAIYSSAEPKENRSAREGNRSGGGAGKESNDEFSNPLLELPSVKFHSAGREVLLTKIYDNITNVVKPCTDSTGTPFDPPPKTLETVIALEITRNEPIGANQPAVAIQYANAVNSDVFWGQPAGIWRVKEIVPERQERKLQSSVVPFLRVTYSFEGNPNGWDLQLLDYGPEYLRQTPVAAAVANVGLQRVRFQTVEGAFTSGLLNGRGGPLPPRLPCAADAVAAEAFSIPTSTITYSDGDLVNFSNIGGALPTNAATGAAISGTYYVRDFAAAGGGGYKFNIANTEVGTAIDISNAGTGTHYVSSPGVFFTIRPFNRLPFAFLGLPQNFLGVQ